MSARTLAVSAGFAERAARLAESLDELRIPDARGRSRATTTAVVLKMAIALGLRELEGRRKDEPL